MNTPVFTPSGVPLTDGIVHPDRPYVLSINSESEAGLRGGEASRPGVSRYTYPTLASCDADYYAAKKSRPACPCFKLV